MAFGCAVITFSGFNSPYAAKAPRAHSILRGLGSSEHLLGNLVLVERKNLCPFFFFGQYALTEISFVHMHERWNGVMNAFMDG